MSEILTSEELFLSNDENESHYDNLEFEMEPEIKLVIADVGNCDKFYFTFEFKVWMWVWIYQIFERDWISICPIFEQIFTVKMYSLPG